MVSLYCLILESQNSDGLNNAMYHSPSLVRRYIKTRKKVDDIKDRGFVSGTDLSLCWAVKGKLGTGKMSVILKA